MTDALAGIYIEPVDSLNATGPWKVFEWPSAETLEEVPNRERAEWAGKAIAEIKRLEYKGRWEGWW